MNRILICFIQVCLYLVFSGSDMNAQKIQFGLQTGFDISRIQVLDKKDYSDNEKVYHSFKSLNINGYLSYKTKSFLGVSIEPGYIKKGGIRKDYVFRSSSIIFAPQDVSYYSNIIQLPVFLDFFVTDRFYISIGPELDLILNSHIKSDMLSFNVTESVDKYELSGGIRLTYNIIKHLDVGVLYNHSITSFSDMLWIDDFYNPIDWSKEYNQYVQLLLRFKI